MTTKKAVTKQKFVYVVRNEECDDFWGDRFSSLEEAKQHVEENGCDDEEYSVYEARLVASSPTCNARKWVNK